MRQDLVFGTYDPGHIQISDTGTRVCRGSWGTAIGSQVMRGGKHLARFKVAKEDRISFNEIRAVVGLVRPLPWAAFEHSDLQLIRNYVLVHVRGNRDLTGSGYDSDVEIIPELARLLRNETISSVRCGGCDVHCCAYSLVGGVWYSTNWGETYIAREDWPGMEDMQENGE
ncbi:hypothetical protein THAOC_11217, partial [Thalassiosira oceanica]